ncbi:MAG: hypothetical protein OZ921_02365 [Sorangiineae bacterium]|nr:hypothetical protein [Polyangiaceae bacterium]MEB2321329.1 hypothetical protein [Sorangiineae bacterium]
MEPRTHLTINRSLCGEPVALEGGRATVALTATPEMAADERGLVHGGFIFGLADYAAMLAVNEPTVVLASADSTFRAPVVVGERVVAEANVTEHEGKRYRVHVDVRRGETVVMSADFSCAVPSRHVLDR